MVYCKDFEFLFNSGDMPVWQQSMICCETGRFCMQAIQTQYTNTYCRTSPPSGIRKCNFVYLYVLFLAGLRDPPEICSANLQSWNDVA